MWKKQNQWTRKKFVIHISNDVQPFQNFEHQRQPASTENFPMFSLFILFFFCNVWCTLFFSLRHLTVALHILCDVFLFLFLCLVLIKSFFSALFALHNVFHKLKFHLWCCCGFRVHSSVNLWLCKQVFQQNNPNFFCSTAPQLFWNDIKQSSV